MTPQKIAHPQDFDRLLARIHRRFQTVTSPTILLGKPYDFTRIKDPNRVLDDVVAEVDRLEKTSGNRRDSENLRLPYWAELWDSALGMSQVLIRRFARIDSLASSAKPISCDALDLGCGQGFTGMIAASLGCNVLFADLESHALLFAKLNSLRYTQSARTKQLNWQTTRLDEKFDLIIGADILYERKQWDFLEPFWQHHLKPDGHILLGEPSRHTGDNFPQWIQERGWKLQIHEEPVATHVKPIRLFELTR